MSISKEKLTTVLSQMRDSCESKISRLDPDEPLGGETLVLAAINVGAKANTEYLLKALESGALDEV